MTLQELQDLTGITVSERDAVRYNAQIERTRTILEAMLGYTLNSDDVQTNFYTETGKAPTECPCPNVSAQDLQPADALVHAYRLYDYNRHDVMLHIDPALTVDRVKLVKDGVTYRTFDPDEYMVRYSRGVAQYIDLRGECACLCVPTCGDCSYMQLAVEADWLWDGATVARELPKELQMVWADMVTSYADQAWDVRSQTLGTHSYTKFDRLRPEEEAMNLAVIKRYAGPNGSVNRIPTL